MRCFTESQACHLRVRSPNALGSVSAVKVTVRFYFLMTEEMADEGALVLGVETKHTLSS